MRILVLLFLALGALFALENRFASCEAKNQLAFVKNGSFVGIAVSTDQLIVPFGMLDRTLLPKEWELVRSDLLTGLALVKASHSATPVDFRTSKRMDEHDRFAVILPDESSSHAVAKRQNGLCALELDKPVISGAVLCAPCYAVMGIGVLGRVVESDFVLHFLHSDQKEFFWGDLGFRLFENSNKIEFVDFSHANNQFKPADQVLSINDQNFTNTQELEQAILLLAPESTAKLTLIRDGKKITVETKVARRLGGGILADTFLESLGWRFDTSLYVNSIEKNSFVGSKNVKISDKLIEINGVSVKSSRDIKTELAKPAEKVKLLLERDGFQFFVVIDKDKNE